MRHAQFPKRACYNCLAATFLACLALNAFALTDEDVRRMKEKSSGSTVPPIPDTPLPPPPNPNEQGPCWRRVDEEDARRLGIRAYRIDCVTGSQLPGPHIEYDPLEGKRTELLVSHLPVWRVHTRSRTANREGTIRPELAREGYKVCTMRAQRVSDIGNGNKWFAHFRTDRDAGIRYFLKRRPFGTDSDLASQSFAIQIYYIPIESFPIISKSLQQPPHKWPKRLSKLLKGWHGLGITCGSWSAGNDDFKPKPARPRGPSGYPLPPIEPMFRVTGEITCVGPDGRYDGATIRSSAVDSSCSAARMLVTAYFYERDRCRYRDNGNFLSSRWDGSPIKWHYGPPCVGN